MVPFTVDPRERIQFEEGQGFDVGYAVDIEHRRQVDSWEEIICVGGTEAKRGHEEAKESPQRGEERA